MTRVKLATLAEDAMRLSRIVVLLRHYRQHLVMDRAQPYVPWDRYENEISHIEAALFDLGLDAETIHHVPPAIGAALIPRSDGTDEEA